MQHLALAIVIFLAISEGADAQSPAPGHRIYQPFGSTDTVMVDNAGNVVHTWPGAFTALSIHLLEDGSLLRSLQVVTGPAGGGTGAIQRIGLDGSVQWYYVHAGADFLSHHDIHPMPNGNVLLIAWERKTVADTIAQGRDLALMDGSDFRPDSIVEVQPTGPSSGSVVWEWHVWDHLVQDHDPTLPNFGVVADHPELVDVNFPPEVPLNGDWNHANGIDYDPINDWIVLSAREQGEIWIIDHSTTTAEAAGHTGGRWGRGGDLLYRWGNPQAYDRGTASDQQLFGQHDPRFIPPGYRGAGHVTVFNNSFLPSQSAVFEIDLPPRPNGRFQLNPGQSYRPNSPFWSYTSPTFFSEFVSGAQRLPNGNTLICSGIQNEVFEVTHRGAVVWSHMPSTFAIFHAHYVERTLWSGPSSLSFAAGGDIDLDAISGSRLGGNQYLILGSASGTAPGFSLGGVDVPLNQDFLLFAMAGAPNSGPFQDNLGNLSLLGRGNARLVVPPIALPPGATGLRLDFSNLVFDSSFLLLEASNSVSLTLLP